MTDTAKRRPHMSEDELRALPVGIPLVEAARAFGMGRTKAHELVRKGAFPTEEAPCRVLRCGGAWIVPKPALLEALGYPTPEIPLDPATP
ncbi:hypothetical protein ABZW11_16945 [Nonomuraea sp. NPDC004580]|uniref:hypothetical protein n=1 Tax=Nonomuraea sp. NPDC004580 TaxID=3154552 RepID=UPI0033AC0B6E